MKLLPHPGVLEREDNHLQLMSMLSMVMLNFGRSMIALNALNADFG
jgi:hypothetical protein